MLHIQPVCCEIISDLFSLVFYNLTIVQNKIIFNRVMGEVFFIFLLYPSKTNVALKSPLDL